MLKPKLRYHALFISRSSLSEILLYTNIHLNRCLINAGKRRKVHITGGEENVAVNLANI